MYSLAFIQNNEKNLKFLMPSVLKELYIALACIDLVELGSGSKIILKLLPDQC